VTLVDQVDPSDLTERTVTRGNSFERGVVQVVQCGMAPHSTKELIPMSPRFLSALVLMSTMVACSGSEPTAPADEGTDQALTNGKTFIVSATVYNASSNQPQIVTPGIGFFSDVFDGKQMAVSFCYVGNADDVCGLIKNYEKNVSPEVTGDFDNGGITVNSCAVSKNVANVSWTAVWDRNPDQHFTKAIAKCETTKN
jgi:hypothetical protein